MPLSPDTRAGRRNDKGAPPPGEAPSPTRGPWPLDEAVLQFDAVAPRRLDRVGRRDAFDHRSGRKARLAQRVGRHQARPAPGGRAALVADVIEDVLHPGDDRVLVGLVL